MPSLKNATENRSIADTGEMTRCRVDEYLLFVHRSGDHISNDFGASRWALTHHVTDIHNKGVLDWHHGMPGLGGLVENLEASNCDFLLSLMSRQP